MSQPNIVVDFGLLEQGAQSLKSQAQALQGYIDDLNNSLQPMEQSWMERGDSSAADAAQQLKTQLLAATNDIVNTISNFAGAVGQAHSDQYAMEQSIRQSFS